MLYPGGGAVNCCLMILRYGAVENSTAAMARRIIKDLFLCKYKGGFGEKILKFEERSGNIVQVTSHI